MSRNQSVKCAISAAQVVSEGIRRSRPHPLSLSPLSDDESVIAEELEWQGSLGIDISFLHDAIQVAGTNMSAYLKGILETRSALMLLGFGSNQSTDTESREQAISYCLNVFRNSQVKLDANLMDSSYAYRYALCETCCMALLHLEPTLGRQCYLEFQN